MKLLTPFLAITLIAFATGPCTRAEDNSAIETKLKQYREHEARLTSEPETGEGLKELMAKGKALEVQRDRAMRKDPYFDYGQALLQIAIVLASVVLVHNPVVVLLVLVPAGAAWVAVLSVAITCRSGSATAPAPRANPSHTR